jgi:hypothetical protein
MRKQKVPELIEFIHAKTETRPDGTVVGVGPHIGCVIARRVRCRNRFTGRFKSAYSVGWSQVNVNAGDTFNKEDAVKIARKRAITGNAPAITRKMLKPYERMFDRAARYFQFITWA